MTSPGIIEIDLHGKNQYQAKVALDAALRKANSGTYRIRVIHGFNHGTELRDMIRQDYSTHPKVRRIATGTNSGMTELILRELL
jgi:DNA-nicking Smr family endonuclease